jgi:thiol-disulfide isomerase/thioredoxin
MITSWTSYPPSGSMRQLMAVLVLALCLTSTTAVVAEESIEQYFLKRTILVEERTAIWCPSCAEIDPELSMVSQSHGARTAIVGLHIGDEFENEASLARIEYQMQTDDSEYGTPTFFVDGIKTAEGYDAWSDVQKRILSQESARQAPEDIAMELIGDDVEITPPDYGQLTVMVLQHEKVVPVDADNPGEDTRDRVLVGMKIVDSMNNTTIYGNLQLPEYWSIILIHEPIEGGEPYGVVEVSNQIWEINEDDNLFQILVACILLGALVVFTPVKKFYNKEEE